MRTVCLLLLAACAPADRLTLAVTPEDEAAVRAFVSTLHDERIEVIVRNVPESGTAARWALVPDEALPDEAFEVRPRGHVTELRGEDLLGRLYALSAALEQVGYAFPHPQHTDRPELLDPSATSAESGTPEMRRRGLHLHTLHPIEAMFDAWMPSDAGVDRMEHVFDWIVRNRGNHVQWVALDDITTDAGTAAAWRDHTTSLVDAAHLRGLSTGLAIQLFGASNLQAAFDLVDTARTSEERVAEMGPRLDSISGLGFDLFNLSFGEFFGAEPAEFVAAVQETYDAIHAREPDAELTATLHVGDDLRAEWEGKEIPYYFLALEAERPITPWVHTVMFYGLFGDAGGAYGHEDFSEHRELLLERLEDRRPVGYFPESAYWIAFDSPIPQFLPVYITQRWRDLALTRATLAGRGTLQDHVLFSSGWEWGYSLIDAATLRMTYTLPDRPQDAVDPLFPLGPFGRDLAANTVVDFAEAQDDALLGKRLAPWLASQDAIMEVGFGLGIVAQPYRPPFAELVDAQGSDLVDLQTTRDAARAHANAISYSPYFRLTTRLPEAGWSPQGERLQDAFAVYAHRARYAETLLTIAAAEAEHRHGGGPAVSGLLWDQLDRILNDATDRVHSAHNKLWDPGGRRLLDPAPNPTIYDFGYLHRADTLCFWHRERAQLRNVVLGEANEVPGCAL